MSWETHRVHRARHRRPIRTRTSEHRAAELAANQAGVLSLAELKACGLSGSAVRRRVAGGSLYRVHRGVFAVGHPGISLGGLFIAAVKAGGPGAVLSHRAAACHWELLAWQERLPEITVEGSSIRGGPGVHVHRTRFLDPCDRHVVRGVPITAPARTIVDLASVVPERQLRRALRQAQSLQLVSIAEILDAMERLGPRRGAAKLARILAAGAAPTRSELEDLVLEVILGGDLEHPDVNVPLILQGQTVVPDFRWPAQKLIVEADGRQWHDNKLAREADAERQALLEAHGERVLRVTWEQTVGNPGLMLRRIRKAGAPAALSSVG